MYLNLELHFVGKNARLMTKVRKKTVTRFEEEAFLLPSYKTRNVLGNTRLFYDQT